MDFRAAMILAADYTPITTPTGDDNACRLLDCLPVLRWGSTIGGLTSRTDDPGLANIKGWFTSIPANITGLFLSIGDNLWSAAASIERMADGTSGLLDTFGRMANRFTGAVWSAFSDWRILSICIILVVGVSLWRYIHNGTIQAFGQRMTALVLGLAMFATVGIASANNTEKPATLTPYWMVVTTSKVVGDLAGSAAATVSDAFDNSGTFLAYSNGKGHPTGDLLSCRLYLNQLHLEDKAVAKSSGKARDTVLTALNRMWEETGLRIYARTQYGPGVNADQVFCRVPEYRAGATAKNMSDITNRAVYNAYGEGGHFTTNGGDAMAWYPDLWDANLDTKDSAKTTGEDVFLDRWVTMWDTCGYGKYRKTTYVRSGWGFVNSIEGEGRGVKTDGKPVGSGDVPSLVEQCNAAISANTKWNTKAGTAMKSLEPSTLLEGRKGANDSCPKIGREGRYCREQKGTASEDFKSMKAITNKFNIRTDSGWRSLSQTNNNTDDEPEIKAAQRTLSYQQGKMSLSELGGALVFAVSGVVNLLIWGIGFGLIRMLTLALACLVAAGGFWLGLLFYAFSPEKGKKALVNATKRVAGMCAAGSVLGLVASTGCLFVTSAMAGLGLNNNNGTTTGNTMLLAVASAVLPFVYLWAIRYICVNVWRIGDPFSGEGLFKMIGGQAIMGGLKTLGGAALGGAAGAIGAAMGGGGVKDILGAAAQGAGVGRPHGALGRAVGTAMAAKDHTELRNALRARTKDDRPGSDADRAAIDKDGEGSKEAEEAAGGDGMSAEDSVRDRFRRELEAKGLKGEKLEKALDEKMASDEGRKAVETAKAAENAEDSVRDRLREELKAQGYEGEDLEKALDEKMKSKEARQAVKDLKAAGDGRSAEDTVRDRFRKELEAKGLKGDRLEKALDERMASDEGLKAVSDLENGLRHSKAEQAVRDRFRKELEDQGLEGDDLTKALDERMASDDGRKAVSDLENDMRRADAEDKVRDRLRTELEGRGLKGRGLEKALDRAMESDEGRDAVDAILHGDRPTDAETSRAEQAVRDRFQSEAEARGLEGAALEAAVDGRMRSAEGHEAVSALADRLHDEADVSAEDRDHARREVFGQRSRELQKAGLKGDDLKRELDDYMDSDKGRAAVDNLARANHERRVYGDDIRRAEDAKRAELREGLAAQGLTGAALDRRVEEAMRSDPVRMDIMRAAHAAHDSAALASLGVGAPTPTEADHMAAYDPTADDMAEAQRRVRERVTADERKRLLESGSMTADDPAFQSTLEKNVDGLMASKSVGEDIRNLASDIHHGDYMAAMDRRVANLGLDARDVLDRRMDAERERLMAGNPDLSIAEVTERARNNVLTESGLASAVEEGGRHALAGMTASLNGNANDMIAAADRLGVTATQEQLDDATDAVRRRLTERASADGLSGVRLADHVDAMMASDEGRAMVRAQALSMNPQVAEQAGMARAAAVDKATVDMLRTGRYADAAEARAEALTRNRLTTQCVAEGLSGDALSDRVETMMADPTVRARMAADADVLRANPRTTDRFARMAADADSTLKGRYGTAVLSGASGLDAARQAVMGSKAVQTGGAVLSAVGSTAGAVARTAAAHPGVMAAAAAATAPFSLPLTAAVATAAMATHTLASPNGFAHRAIGAAKPYGAKIADMLRSDEPDGPVEDGTPYGQVSIPTTADLDAMTAPEPSAAPAPELTPRTVSGGPQAEPASVFERRARAQAAAAAMPAPTVPPVSFMPKSDDIMPASDPRSVDGAADIDSQFGAGTAWTMATEGLASPDTAARASRGEAVLPQPRSGYTDETAADAIRSGSTYGSSGDPTNRPTPMPAAALTTVASAPAVKASVEAYAQTVGLDRSAAVHLAKHPAATLRDMGVNVADDREAGQVASALGRLGVAAGGDAVADAARTIRSMDGADTAAALRVIRHAMPSAPAAPMTTSAPATTAVMPPVSADAPTAVIPTPAPTVPADTARIPVQPTPAAPAAWTPDFASAPTVPAPQAPVRSVPMTTPIVSTPTMAPQAPVAAAGPAMAPQARSMPTTTPAVSTPAVAPQSAPMTAPVVTTPTMAPQAPVAAAEPAVAPQSAPMTAPVVTTPTMAPQAPVAAAGPAVVPQVRSMPTTAPTVAPQATPMTAPVVTTPIMTPQAQSMPTAPQAVPMAAPVVSTPTMAPRSQTAPTTASVPQASAPAATTPQAPAAPARPTTVPQTQAASAPRTPARPASPSARPAATDLEAARARGRHEGASYAKARSDAARQGGDGSERPAMASADAATAEANGSMRSDLSAMFDRSGNPAMSDTAGASILDGLGVHVGDGASTPETSGAFYDDPVGTLRANGVPDEEIGELGRLIRGFDGSPTEFGERVADMHRRFTEGR